MAKKQAKSGNKVLNSALFPNPLATPEEKAKDAYGLQYARAIESQWDLTNTTNTFFSNRIRDFEEQRDYSHGRQNTDIYKQVLSALDNNDNDGSLLSLDWRPVPIVPKFRNIVVNKILARNLRPNLEAIDPISLTEKDEIKASMRAMIKNRDLLEQAKAAGIDVPIDPAELPETTEEAEIFVEGNVKTSAEIAAQLSTSLTLQWNAFNETTLRRCAEDLTDLGMAVVKRELDPTYGIVERYVNPSYFIHSYTEDPNFSDLRYAGHIEQLSVDDVKRISERELTDEDYRNISSTYSSRYDNELRIKRNNILQNQYDEFTVDVLFFNFKTTECIYFEEKETKYGNKGFYKKGYEYKEQKNSVFERKPYKLETEVTYSGAKVVGTNVVLYYKKDQNQPRNLYDISKTNLSYSAVAVNIRDMTPTSLIGKVRGFADMLQITHLKMQQAIAKAKSDGVAIDIEGLENVDLGTGATLDPIDLHDIYEKTSVFYWRSKTIDGQRTQTPVQPIPNSIRNIQELANVYNLYLNMIRDATGINEAMDGSSPRGEQLVGVRQQAIAAGNNAIYDVENAVKLLYKKVTEDIVKCLQVLPKESVLFKIYEKAIGKYNMQVLNAFAEIPMINIGVTVQMDMDENQLAYLEQNIQVSLAAKEIDIEDAIAIRNMQDIDQAEQLLIVRRKKRMKRMQEIANQNSQMQAQMNVQTAQAKAQGDAELEQIKAQMEMQKAEQKFMFDMQLLDRKYSYEIELRKHDNKAALKQMEFEQRSELEEKREQAKDERIDKQAALQSHMIEQRKGTAPVIQKPQDDMLSQLMGS